MIFCSIGHGIGRQFDSFLPELKNLNQWTTAFLRLVAIYAAKFPNATTDHLNLIKHAGTFRDMAAAGNVSWQT